MIAIIIGMAAVEMPVALAGIDGGVIQFPKE
jgi:hypothetical protein